MSERKKLYLDTAPIIYYIEKVEVYYEKVAQLLEQYGAHSYITSTITVMEVLAVKGESRDVEWIEDQFERFVRAVHLDVRDISEKYAKKAGEIRRKWGFKPMDALQLAVAVCTECNVFVTNDRQLKQFDEIACLLIEEAA